MGWFATKQEKLDEALLDACYASRDGNFEKVKALLEQGADTRHKDGYKRTPLYRAIESGSLKTAQLLADGKADVNERDAFGQTLLMCAHGERAVEFVLGLGVDVHAKDSNGATALHYAASRGDFGAVKKLLEAGADFRVMNNSGNKPVDLAKGSHHEGIASFLLEYAQSFALTTAAVTAGWALSAPQEVIFAETKQGAGYCLTSIFNFNARIYTQIARNLTTGAESQSIRFFDEFPDKTLLETAFGQLRQLGGNTQGISIHGTVLDKGGPG